MNREELRAKYGKKKVPNEWRKTDFVSKMVCTFFGAGMLPKMPGTFGSLAAAIVALPLAILAAKTLPESWPGNALFFAAAVLVFFGAIPFADKAMRDAGTEDPGWIVIDEVCGIWMTLAFVQANMLAENLWLVLVAFVLFRFFDILKPFGIHKAEKFPGAWGVMADDLLGGIYAGILLWAVSTLL